MSASQAAPLRGRQVLVVEDEWLIAESLAQTLRQLGAEVLGPVPTLEKARALVEGEGRIDLALLDVNLGGERVWPLVELLQTRRVPIVLSSGYDNAAIPAAYQALPCCEKPFGRRQLVRVLGEVLDGR